MQRSLTNCIGEKGAECLVRAYRGIDTKETGGKGKAAIAYSGSICHCNKFTSEESKGKRAET